jgi:hypothetical protein
MSLERFSVPARVGVGKGTDGDRATATKWRRENGKARHLTKSIQILQPLATGEFRERRTAALW